MICLTVPNLFFSFYTRVLSPLNFHLCHSLLSLHSLLPVLSTTFSLSNFPTCSDITLTCHTSHRYPPPHRRYRCPHLCSYHSAFHSAQYLFAFYQRHTSPTPLSCTLSLSYTFMSCSFTHSVSLSLSVLPFPQHRLLSFVSSHSFQYLTYLKHFPFILLIVPFFCIRHFHQPVLTSLLPCTHHVNLCHLPSLSLTFSFYYFSCLTTTTSSADYHLPLVLTWTQHRSALPPRHINISLHACYTQLLVPQHSKSPYHFTSPRTSITLKTRALPFL